ncbi:MAG: histidine phosphatase family protein [Dehalococcoidales bacterium]|jgi:probable phosphoglycerate mutase|nr:histidine phosphatase family protein [Dehalococcoidales bacterium]
MTTIILIRHGDTDWNVEEIFRGRVDVELNENGIKQAQLLAKYLEDVPVKEIYTSPLKRALKTAEIIAGPHNANIIPSNELIDFDYGEWQGLSHDKVKNQYKTLYEEWLKSPQLVRMPKGESLDDVRKRAVSLINQVIVRHQGIIALVSHRVILKVIICALLGLDNSYFWNIRVDTCGITIFNYEMGRFILTRHNCTVMESNKSISLSDF